MALIHGERPSDNSPEARIYDLLASSLDDKWQVWHEPTGYPEYCMNEAGGAACAGREGSMVFFPARR